MSAPLSVPYPSTYEKAVHYGVDGLFVREGIRGSSSP